MDFIKKNILLLNNKQSILTGVDIDYYAVLDESLSNNDRIPSLSQQVIQNQLMLDLKSNGIWVEEDIFYLPANNGSKGFSTLNWKDPENFKLIEKGNISWYRNNGFLPDDATGGLDSQFIPSTHGVKYIISDAGITSFVVSNKNWLNGYALFGCSSLDNNIAYFLRNSETNVSFRIHLNQVYGPGVGDSGAIILGSQNLSWVDDYMKWYSKGVRKHNVLRVASGIPAVSLYFSSYNDNGVLSVSSRSTQGQYSAGSAHPTLQSIKHTLINNYINLINS